MISDQLIKDIARQTISIEMRALNDLFGTLDGDFVKAVQLISNSYGRVVLTGIGKSALVAQKIVATLNSTGTPSMFMHAADAVHGDLGMIGEKDILMCLSKSGNTAEIKVLLPLVKQFGNPTIGISCDAESYLAQHADYFIHIPMEKEADPNNLAPTTSTTLQMVIGDAMAMSLLALKGFSPKDFSRFHPGGLLGKQLYLRIKDIYKNNNQPAVGTKDNLRNIILSMTFGRLGITVVVDENGKAIGVITDGDLRRMLEQEISLDDVEAQEIMTQDPVFISSESLAVEALQLLREKSITQLVVQDDDKYMGVIHLHDLIKEGII